MGIGKRIKEARDRLGLTQKQLAELVGVTASAVTNYENETSHPKETVLYALLKALKVDANFLFQDEMDQIAPSFDQREQTLIKKYRSVDDHGRRTIDTVAEYEYERCCKEDGATQLIEFPVAYESAAAGYGNYLTDSGLEYVSVDKTAIPGRAKFGVKVSGNSMEPEYHSGDILLVEPMPAIPNGDLGIFNLNGEGFFKKLLVDHDKKMIILRSLNPDYPDRVVLPQETLITYGKVIGKM